VIVKPLPNELREILYRIAESGLVPASPRDYVIPNRRRARNPERSPTVIYQTVKRRTRRCECAPHAIGAAFAVHYLESHPGDLDALQKLMGHARSETTAVYLRRQDRVKALQRVRDVTWNLSALRPNALMPPAGFEPALRP
jgi:integrase